MLKQITHRLDRIFYPDATRIWDDERFVELIKKNIQSDSHILDFGCGRGKTDILGFRGQVEHVAGVDVDIRVLENPHLDEKHVIGPGKPIPFVANSFDLIFSCNVLEHVTDPGQVFCELNRVLKPGGLLLVKTTNKNHYVACAARVTPLWFHKKYNRLRGREVVDTFPTTYKCNSRRQIQKIAKQAGLSIEFLEFWEWRPEYLRISPVTYVGGIVYEKVVNSTRLLAPLRAVMVIGLRKPAASV